METVKFKKSFLGYDRGAVDRFVEKVMQEYNQGCKYNGFLEQEIRNLRESGESTDQAIDIMVEAELSAIRTTAAAKAEAERIIETARREIGQEVVPNVV